MAALCLARALRSFTLSFTSASALPLTVVPQMVIARTLKTPSGGAGGKKKGGRGGRGGDAVVPGSADAAAAVLPPSPYRPDIINMGSMAGLVEHPDDVKDREESEDGNVRILRPARTMGFDGKRDEIIAPERGYSGRELEELSDVERLQEVDFLHLTMNVIEEHTDRLKPLCPPVPALESKHAVRFTTRHVYTGDHSYHALNAKVTLSVSVSALGLDEAARGRLAVLAQARYNKDTDTLVLNSSRFPTLSANKLYLSRQLRQLIDEAKKSD